MHGGWWLCSGLSPVTYLTVAALPSACAPTVSCAAYDFGDGVVGGDTNGCTDGIALSVDSDCAVKCDSGYTGDAATVTCASGASAGDASTSSIACSGDVRAIMHPCAAHLLTVHLPLPTFNSHSFYQIAFPHLFAVVPPALATMLTAVVIGHSCAACLTHTIAHLWLYFFF